MTGLIIAGVVVLLLAALLMTRVGGLVRFGEAGLTVRVRVGFVRVTVFPPKKKAPRGVHPAAGKQKPKKEKKKQEEPETGPGGAWETFQMYLRIALDAAARFRRKLRIDRLELDLLWAARDPAAAALGFGYANAAVAALLPPLERAFDVRNRRVRTAVDFEGTSPTVFVTAECSMTIGQGIAFALAALTQYLQGKKNIRKEAASR